MKKTELATMAVLNNQYSQLLDHGIEALGKIIESSISALATVDPELAISVIKQLNDQIEGIEQLKNDRKASSDKKIKMVAEALPNNIEFDEEESEENEEIIPKTPKKSSRRKQTLN